jgi:hypothetical protein
MNPLQTNMLNALVGAAIALTAIATAAPARAEAFAQSILVIDNLRLTRANGTPFRGVDFAAFSGGSAGYAGSGLNGQFANLLQAGSGDVPQQVVGALPPRPENSFLPFAHPAGASYGAADQLTTGELITTAAGAAGATLSSRADAALGAAGAATGNAGMASATTFLFELGADELMTISFDAFAFSAASVDGAQSQQNSASAQLAWTISVLDVTNGAVVFTFQPEELNAMSHVGRATGLAGTSSYDPGWMAFSATVGALSGGTAYHLSISQSAAASVLGAQPMPEPGTLSAIGAGLLAMAALGRRRRR